MENEELKKQLEELMHLFKKMIEKYPPDEIPGVNKSQLEQLKLFFSNYDEMKDNFSIEMLGPFNNDMTKKIIPMLINRLK